ncbi:MAG: hypothetical protein ABUK01_08315 [Leptospirales bacterium]
MKHIFHLTITSLLFCFLSLGLFSNTRKADISLSMVYSNAISDDLPNVIFDKGKKWTPDPKARFIKLHMYFDQRVSASAINIDTCGDTLKNNVTMFINFDQWVMNLDKTEDFYSQPEKVIGQNKEKFLTIKFPEEQRGKIRSITINFETNTDFSICDISLTDTENQKQNIVTPKIVPGSVVASNTLKPDSAYNVMNLFDSRFEFGWATDGVDEDVVLDFNFKKTTTITKLKIWNGYQRSALHCFSNSRPKTLLLEGDKGYSVELEVEDIMGSQVIKLPKPFKGKNLQMTIVNSYAGKKYKDLVISELRFHNGKQWFMLNPLPQIKSIISNLRKNFRKGGLEQILNNGLIGEIYTDEGSNFSKLRLRADGSFYISGFASSYESEIQTNYFGLGNYTVRKVSSGGIELSLFGLYYRTEEVFYGDCNGCGRDCNTPEEDNNQKIFSIKVLLSPGEKGAVQMKVLKGSQSIKISDMTYLEEQ